MVNFTDAQDSRIVEALGKNRFIKIKFYKMSTTLSKTDFILFRECPKNVWYKIHRPDIYYESELSDFEKAIIDTGNEVEIVARQMFPEGVLIEGRDIKAQDTTRDYISKNQPVIFQSIFSVDNFLAALDILKFNPEDRSYSIYEVKATSEIDDKSHYHDLAFQVILLRKLGYRVKSSHLIHLNSEYVRSGDLNITELFKIEDVTTAVDGLCLNVLVEMEKAVEYLSSEKEPDGSCCCIYKGRSKHCSTFKHSNPHVPEYGVHDISRIGNSKAKLQELVDGNIFDLKDIPAHIKFSDIQKNQITTHTLNEVIIQKDKIAEELNILLFPLYFLDYETFPCAIPRFDGFIPYQQIPFQYSLHVLDSVGAELKHFEFLHVDSCDPSDYIARSLQKNIGNTGSVIVWNKTFECKINKELGFRVPGLKNTMDSVNNRIYDLMDIFLKQYYVHKEFKGKTSIKSVLPILVPDLSYKVLNIQEGGTASQQWNKIVTANITDKERNEIAQSLKEYCKLDTYAMYAIWHHLKELC
jgi:hypothetical protein